MTQPPWTPDFSRAPQSAHAMWQTITSSKAIAAIVAMNLSPADDAALAAQLGGAKSKSAAALAAEQFTPEEDELAARCMPEYAAVIRTLANAVRPGS